MDRFIVTRHQGHVREFIVDHDLAIDLSYTCDNLVRHIDKADQIHIHLLKFFKRLDMLIIQLMLIFPSTDEERCDVMVLDHVHIIFEIFIALIRVLMLGEFLACEF